MITLSSIPRIVLGRDPLFVTFQTDNFQSQAGSYAFEIFKLSSLPGNGSVLTITIGTDSYVFTCATNPGGSDKQFAVPNNGESILDYTTRVIYPLLKNNYYINAICDVTLSGDKITITKLEKESCPIVVSSAGFSHTGVYGGDGADVIYRENFKINYRIVSETTGKPLIEYRSLEPDADGMAEVDISCFTKNIAISSFVFNSETVHELLAADSVPVYVQCWESYGFDSDAVRSQMQNSPVFNVINGESSYMDQALLNSQDKTWADNISKCRWLTKKPNNCNVLPNQKILLKLLFYSFTKADILFVVKYTDADGSLTYSKTQITKPDLYSINQFDASPERHNISDTCAKIDVYLETSLGTLLSDSMTFNIDRNYHYVTRQYLFENPLGGFDSIQALGAGTATGSYKRVKTRSALKKKHINTDRQTKVVAVTPETKCVVNLGFTNNWGDNRFAWGNFVHQFNSTKNAFEIIQGIAYPIDIITKSQKLIDDNIYLDDTKKIEYTRAYVETAPENIPMLDGAYSDHYNEQYD